MDKKTYYKFLFLIVGIWNIFGGILFFILSYTTPSVFALSGTITPPTLIFYHVMSAMISIYGIGYLMISRDIEKNTAVVIIGGLSKLMFFLATLIYMIIREINATMLLIGLTDLFLVILFAEFLMNKKKL